MKNHDILEKFLDIQKDTMFGESIPLGFAEIIYNPFDATPFWNYALTSQILNRGQISVIEEKLKALNRKPAIYFEHADIFIPFEKFLEKNGYRINNEDSWMSYEGKSNSTRNFKFIKRVESLQDLRIWSDTLDKCYVANDPQNPYGKLGAYINLAERAWEKNHPTGKFEYFTAFKENKPVAVATLTYQDDLGYISNVGSLQGVRGQGFGKLITLYCVNQAKKKNINEIYVATEEGTYPNEFYKRIGFKTRFTARCYVKS